MKIYVEFFGGWNINDESREKYKEKKDVYFNNNIPCIYVYPENLGVFDYLFNERVISVMTKHKMKKQVREFKWDIIRSEKQSVIWWIFLFALLIAYGEYDNDIVSNIGYVVIWSLCIIYQLYRVFQGYLKYFTNKINYDEYQTYNL